MLWREKASKHHFIVYSNTLLAEHLRGRVVVIFYLIEAPAGRILILSLSFFFFVLFYLVFSSGIGNVIGNYKQTWL